MKAGIKVGPEDGTQVLKETGARWCEIWFRVEQKNQYLPLFQHCRKNKINFGLHFWAMIDNKYLPNMLCLEGGVAEKTLVLIKESIDIASRWGGSYVNFHPESYCLALLDLDKGKIKALGLNKRIDKKKSFKQLLFYLEKLEKYGDKKGVIPFTETVPKFSPSDFYDLEKGRLDPQDSGAMETEKYFELAEMGYPLCLDIGHTLSHCISDDRERMFAYLLSSVKKMFKAIGLVHVTTNAPPFNGVDSHHGIREKDFKKGVVPSKEQLIKILSLFKGKSVWLIPEPPKEEMVENYYALKEMVERIEGNW